MKNDEPTLYDWLMQIDGMEEGIAVDIDDRVPEIERIPTPQTLWAYAGMAASAVNRTKPEDPGLLMSLMHFMDNIRVMIAERRDGGSVYARIYKEQFNRSLRRLERSRPQATSHDLHVIAHARARRTATQVFLGHIWEVCYRLDMGQEPDVHFGKPIAPDVPFPAVTPQPV